MKYGDKRSQDGTIGEDAGCRTASREVTIDGVGLGGVDRTSVASFSNLSRMVWYVDWLKPLSSLAFGSFSYRELSLSGP